jgi:hypothetical protein
MELISILIIVTFFVCYQFKVSKLKRALTESQRRERAAISEKCRIKSERVAFIDANGICNRSLFNRLLETEKLFGRFQCKNLVYLYIKLYRESDKSVAAEIVSDQWQTSFMFFEDLALQVAIPSRSHEATNLFDFNIIRQELQSLLSDRKISCSVGVGATLGTAIDSLYSDNSNLPEKDTVFLDGDRTA